MKLADLTVKNETIAVPHPVLGDVGITVELRHFGSREFNSRLADVNARAPKTLNALAWCQSAIVAINGIDDVPADKVDDVLEDDAMFWLAEFVFNHLLKKKLDSMKASDSSKPSSE